jgi:hypothetical protein
MKTNAIGRICAGTMSNGEPNIFRSNGFRPRYMERFGRVMIPAKLLDGGTHCRQIKGFKKVLEVEKVRRKWIPVDVAKGCHVVDHSG